MDANERMKLAEEVANQLRGTARAYQMQGFDAKGFTDAADLIDALRSDLSAARKVGKEDVANAITAAKRASICLYSEVPRAVAEDVSKKVQAVCEIARAALSRAERAEQEASAQAQMAANARHVYGEQLARANMLDETATRLARETEKMAGYLERAKDAEAQLTAAQARLNDIRAETLEKAARVFDDEAAKHAVGALWMGPERQRYEGARIPGVEMSPMNGPAIAHDGALARAARIRALSKDTTPPKRLEVNMAQAVHDGAFSGLSFGLSAVLGRHDT